MKCAIAECPNQARKRYRMCNAHLSRKYRHGDPLYGGPVRKYSANSEEAFRSFTEPDGECIVWTGADDGHYGVISNRGRRVKAHRYAWSRANGPIPRGMCIDHICHNTMCVKADHLRLATVEENLANRAGPTALNRSGYRNVYPVNNGWSVQLRRFGKLHSFGVCRTVEEAAKVAAKAREDLFGEFAGNGVRRCRDEADR